MTDTLEQCRREFAAYQALPDHEKDRLARIEDAFIARAETNGG